MNAELRGKRARLCQLLWGHTIGFGRPVVPDVKQIIFPPLVLVKGMNLFCHSTIFSQLSSNGMFVPPSSGAPSRSKTNVFAPTDRISLNKFLFAKTTLYPARRRPNKTISIFDPVPMEIATGLDLSGILCA